MLVALAAVVWPAVLTALSASGGNMPAFADIRTRMSLQTRLLLYPPAAPSKPDTAAVIFFSGDRGWPVLHQELAAKMASEGRYVVGIDSTEFFTRMIEPTDWVSDLKTLRTFVNGKAGKEPDAPILLVGFTYGAEMIPYILRRSGTGGVAGALLIEPDGNGAAVCRVGVQLKLAPGPAEAFDVAAELRALPKSFGVVLMEGELDIESTARTLADAVPGPHKYVNIPGADRQFHDARDAFYSMVSQSLAWLEGARNGPDPTLPPGEKPEPR